jgi:hypothetical protein
MAGKYQIPKRKKFWTWLGIIRYPRGRNTGTGWELPDTQEEEILVLAGNYQIPMRKKYWTWLGITQEEEYWTWLEIT